MARTKATKRPKKQTRRGRKKLAKRACDRDQGGVTTVTLGVAEVTVEVIAPKPLRTIGSYETEEARIAGAEQLARVIESEKADYKKARDAKPRKQKRNEFIHRLRTEEKITDWIKVRDRLRTEHRDWITIGKGLSKSEVKLIAIKISYWNWRKQHPTT
jgi:hypothetical protein